MKVLFTNHTSEIAYITVVDYDKNRSYIGEPIIFSLEPNQSCYYETTPNYFCGGLVLGATICGTSLVYQNIMEIVPMPDKPYKWRFRPSMSPNINTYLFQHPQIKPAQISNDASADHLRDRMFATLEKHYSLDIKEPEEN